MAKESIGLPDIIKILGDRPFPMKESVREYLQEQIDRMDKETPKPVEEDSAAENSDKKEEEGEKKMEANKENEKKE